MEPWDDYGGYGWKLVIEDEAGEILVDQVDYDRALEFKIVDLPAGTYQFIGEIEDQADNITTHAITVIVEDASADTSGGGDDTGDGSASAGESDGSGGADEDDDEDDGSGDDSSGGGSVGADGVEEGCACANGRRSVASGWLALFVLPLLRRRNRARGI
jgi:hypothetical protein